MWAKANECPELLKAMRGKKWILPGTFSGILLQSEHSSVDTLILDLWPPEL